jgi:hypothetical protein
VTRDWFTSTRPPLCLFGFWLAACSATVEGQNVGGGEAAPAAGGTATAGTAPAAGGTTTPAGGAPSGGSTMEPPGGTAGTGGDVACAPVTARRVRRLSLVQYELVVAELLGAAKGHVSWTAPDVLVHGFDTGADALTISSGNFDDFALAAELVAGAADVATLAPCGTDVPEACASAFAASFAERAYGRPLTPDELERLLGVYRTGAEDGYEAGVRLVIEAVLMSPHFLYRSEIGGEAPPGGEALLSPLEVASALSFAITGARPDAALRTRAQTDPAFLSEGVLREEATRLLAEPRAREELARFLRSWLGVRDVRAINKIPIMYPDFNPVLKADLDQEVALFLAHALGDGGGTLGALFGATFTFANARVLNSVYAYDYAGATPPSVPDDGSFAPIAFADSRRRGVLSLGGWLSAHSPVHRTSPVDRGLTVRSRLFCQVLPAPPPGVQFAAPGASDGLTTTRQKFETHQVTDGCAGCHALMDPIGFGMEMMDAIGRFRDNEAGLPIDSSGMLTDTDVDGPFTGPAELGDKIVASQMVRDCFVTQLFRYVEGRDETPEDECLLARLRQAFSSSDGNIAGLLVNLVLERTFVARRVEP